MMRSDMSVELVDSYGSDRKVAQSARVSTLGLDNDRAKVEGLVKALWRDGHFSPFESSGMTIGLNVPLFVRDQIVRHKSFAFSVKSLRYSKAEASFYSPAFDRPLVQVGKSLDYRREPGSTAQYLTASRKHLAIAEAAWAAYQNMLGEGIADEVARGVLPTTLYTDMWMTGSLRSWLHFLDQRLDEHAQHEIRDVADQVAWIVKGRYPITYEAWRAGR